MKGDPALVRRVLNGVVKSVAQHALDVPDGSPLPSLPDHKTLACVLIACAEQVANKGGESFLDLLATFMVEQGFRDDAHRAVDAAFDRARSVRPTAQA